MINCVQLRRYRACLFFFCWFLNQYQYNANSESIFIVCSFISHAWHCIINAVFNFVCAVIKFTAPVENKDWMITTRKWSNVLQNYSVLLNTRVNTMGCAKRHMERLFSCFQGVWCVFLGQSTSLWPCWWGLPWRTPASVPALKRGRWWVHLLQFLQHSYNCKIYRVIFQSRRYCELHVNGGLSEGSRTKSCI